LRIRGWLGRADQTTKVKGMFVTPGQIAQVTARHPEVLRARLTVSSANHQDAMHLQCETTNQKAGLADTIAATLQGICKVRGTVELVMPGTLPNDGKVIVDSRTYQ
jgi:phenylacetate-CoA ligase